LFGKFPFDFRSIEIDLDTETNWIQLSKENLNCIYITFCETKLCGQIPTIWQTRCGSRFFERAV